VGLGCRYDGQLKPSHRCIEFLRDKHYIPVCPEQLGGLATPRPPADIVGGNGDDVLEGMAKVVAEGDIDVTAAIVKGARQVLEIARAQNISTAVLKSKSPSCGVADQWGVTAALLARNGVELLEY
jgi:uncharacterized protein YbbK (DUF523 family)